MSAFSLPKLYHIERSEEQNKKQNQVQKKLIKNSKVDMTNNDENVVRTRLLLDGDGTGDDRRLNNISKMVRSVQQQIKFLIIKSIRKLSSPTLKETQPPVSNALSFYRSQNVLCQSKLFVSYQKFIYILCQSQTFCARQKDDLHAVKLVFVPAQKFLKRH